MPIAIVGGPNKLINLTRCTARSSAAPLPQHWRRRSGDSRSMTAVTCSHSRQMLQQASSGASANSCQLMPTHDAPGRWRSGRSSTPPSRRSGASCRRRCTSRRARTQSAAAAGCAATRCAMPRQRPPCWRHAHCLSRRKAKSSLVEFQVKQQDQLHRKHGGRIVCSREGSLLQSLHI